MSSTTKSHHRLSISSLHTEFNTEYVLFANETPFSDPKSFVFSVCCFFFGQDILTPLPKKRSFSSVYPCNQESEQTEWEWNFLYIEYIFDDVFVYCDLQNIHRRIIGMDIKSLSLLCDKKASEEKSFSLTKTKSQDTQDIRNIRNKLNWKQKRKEKMIGSLMCVSIHSIHSPAGHQIKFPNTKEHECECRPQSSPNLYHFHNTLQRV